MGVSDRESRSRGLVWMFPIEDTTQLSDKLSKSLDIFYPAVMLFMGV